MSMMHVAQQLRAPFPWFGGKSKQAAMVWERFGAVQNYVEPFAGSLAVLLGRPQPFGGAETVNDADGFIVNFWRAVATQPEIVERWCDWPVTDLDLWSRHDWLVKQRETLTAELEADPEFCDPKIAGWWVWGICAWIGSGWCAATRKRQRIHTGDLGMGVHSPTSRKRIHTGNAGTGVLALLAERLRAVRVLCGDFGKALQSGVLRYGTTTAVYLDPPYAYSAKREANLYAKDSGTVSGRVREWCLEHGDRADLRIALAGYEGEHELPGWDCVHWKPPAGMENSAKTATQAKANNARERVWFSPHCLATRQGDLFACAS